MLNEKKHDAIHYGESLMYLLEIQNSDIILDENGKISNNIIFNLLPTHGNPDMYINCDTKPDKLENYAWNTLTVSNENILISKDEF